MYLACAPGALGFSLSFKECGEAVSAAGYEGFWFNLVQDSAVSAAETGDLLARWGLRPAGFGLPVDIRAEEPVFREALGKLGGYARFAQAAGLDRAMTWVAPGSDTLDYKGQFEQYRSRIREIAALLGGRGISLGLEFVGTPSFRRTSRHEFIHNLDGLLELIEAAGEPNVGVVLDLWHWDMAGHGPGDFRKLEGGNRVILVHLNDAPEGLSPDEQIDTVRRLPGSTGVLRAGEFLEGIASLDYRGPAVVEPFYPPLAEMPFASAARLTLEAARKVWRP